MPPQIRLQEQNVVLLTGRLTRDANVAYTQKGQTVCRFDIAVNRRYQDTATSEWKDDVSFVPVVLWGPPAERAKDRLKKGVPVGVEGRLSTSEYTDKTTGKPRKSLQVTARRIQILQWDSDTPASARPAAASAEEAVDVGAPIDDDVPF